MRSTTRKLVGLLPLVCALALFGRPHAERAVLSDPYLAKLTGVQEVVDSNGHNVNGTITVYADGLSTSTTGEGMVQGGTTSLVVSGGTTGVSTSTTSTTGSTTATTGTTGTSSTGTTGGSEFYWYVVVANRGGATVVSNDSLGNSPTTISATQMTSYKYPYGSNIGGYQYYYGEAPNPPATVSLTAKYTFGSAKAGSTEFDVGLIGIKAYGALPSRASWEKITVAEQTTTAVSVDSRMMFGQPNAQGQAGLNANDPARPINFSGWYYKGGLFTGNAPFSTGDESGTSRIQAYIATLPTGDLAMSSCLTLYYLANAANFTDSYNLQPYDASTDAHKGIPSTQATWANAWSTSDPLLGSITAMPLSSAQYMNFRIEASGDTQLFAPYVLLAMKPEPPQGSTPQTWSYYVSSTYASQNSSNSDDFPRAWAAYQSGYGTYSW